MCSRHVVVSRTAAFKWRASKLARIGRGSLLGLSRKHCRVTARVDMILVIDLPGPSAHTFVRRRDNGSENGTTTARGCRGAERHRAVRAQRSLSVLIIVVCHNSSSQHAAAKAVASAGRQLQPSSSMERGLGKTHLMHAIGTSPRQVPGKRVVYLTLSSSPMR